MYSTFFLRSPAKEITRDVNVPKNSPQIQQLQISNTLEYPRHEKISKFLEHLIPVITTFFT